MQGSFPIRIVFWQPVLTAHQGQTIRHLKSDSRFEVEVRVLAEEHAERASQGWTRFIDPSVRPVLVPRRGLSKFVASELRREPAAIHVFGSPFEAVRMMTILAAFLLRNESVYLISEPFSPVAVGHLRDEASLPAHFKAWLRPLVYRLYGLLLGPRVAGVFCISDLARGQYEAIGVDGGKLHRFGYFVDRDCDSGEHLKSDRGRRGDCLKIVFVGAMIRRKALRELIGAVYCLAREGVKVTLDVYGSGSPDAYSFDGSICCYRGAIQFGKAQDIIQAYDILVLPSHFDGWGVVVNEAILAGVPVVASRFVGAARMAVELGCGIEFSAVDEASIAQTLRALALDRAKLAQMSEACVVQGDRIAASAAARFLGDVVLDRDCFGQADSAPWSR
jgi:glycosyltransferase involved in cell wall biosynthesis